MALTNLRAIFVLYMPTINKKPIKEKKVNYKHEKPSADFYNSPAWRKLRDTYISLHPICECCLEHEHVEPATEVHHRTPFMRGETDVEKWNLFLSEKNLMALCEKCHLAMHIKDREYSLGSLTELTDTEWRYAHGFNCNK